MNGGTQRLMPPAGHDDAGRLLRIGELASRTGASPRSLRYYEERGLLRSRRGAGGHRWYVEADIAQVQFIRGLLAASLSTAVIGEILRSCDRAPGKGASLTTTMLREERERLTACIERLMNARVHLDQFVAEAEAHDARAHR
jgi:DNA-binding transcriptional MerR regulator